MSKLVMLLLAAYPILSYYRGLAGFSYAELLTLLLFSFACIKEKSIAINISSSYKKFWGYAAISLILTSYISGSFKLTYLIPGGLAFFIWSIALGLTIKYFDFKILKKYLYLIFFIASILLIGQELLYQTIGSRFVPFLPLGKQLTIYDMSYSELVALRTYGPRYCSIFAEPSYFALYALPVLAIELFSMQNKNKPLTSFSIFIIFILLLLKSGVALLGMSLVLFIKFFTFYKNANKSVIVLFSLCCVPVLIFLVMKFIGSETGSDLLARSEEFSSNSSSAYFRVIRGYIIYAQLPLVNKFLGMSTDLLLTLNIPELIYSVDDSSNLYFNGIQTILMKQGLCGLILCFCFYVRLYKQADLISRCLLWILLFYSLVDQIFLSPSMLLCTCIACSLMLHSYKQYK